MTDFGNDGKSAVQAKFDAQKIAFAPIMFQAARVLRSLRILDVIHENRNTGISMNDVSEKISLSECGVKVLLEAALSMELVFVRNDRFYLTKTGWFLVNDPLTQINMDFTHDVNYKGLFHLEDAIKTGKPEGLKVFGSWSTVYEALSELPEQVQKSWFAFDHYYSDAAFPEVLKYISADKPRRILDVGGNTGRFAVFCARNNPDVLITILDLPGQLEKARKNIKENDVADRIDMVPMNLLDRSIPYPENFDLVWMSQFLDCFSQNDAVKLLVRARGALTDGGVIYIMETLWDRQKYEAATYSLHATSLYFTAIANGCSQMYHSDDMRIMIERAGLIIENEHDNIGIGHTLIRCRNKK